MSKAHITDNGHYIIFCPACNCGHIFDGRWKFSGTLDSPTFTPSMHVNPQLKEPLKYGEEVVSHRCHSFVTDGRIRYLNDCTHDMKGQTVDIPDLDKPPY